MKNAACVCSVNVILKFAVAPIDISDLTDKVSFWLFKALIFDGNMIFMPSLEIIVTSINMCTIVVLLYGPCLQVRARLLLQWLNWPLWLVYISGLVCMLGLGLKTWCCTGNHAC
ncbi:hypothetical protein STAS_00927 [Striga asiatica]|uniref:Uncharacterized protein n=1 Tax=Striga asiatica TaxID=4170 RepID=A0A5A7NXY9_STRAF|nr:hypothetical protein STAS_00927 [Striga asiatica]